MKPDPQSSPQLTPSPAVKPAPQPQTLMKAKPLPVMATIAAASIALAVAATYPLWATAPGDELTAQQLSARQAVFESAGQIHLAKATMSNPKEQQAVIQSMALPPAQEQRFRQTLQVIPPRVYWIGLFDDVDEDADAVSISSPSGAYQITVPIFNMPRVQKVPVVLSASESGFYLGGVRDGGGGITVAMTTASGRVIPMPRLMPGEKRFIPLQ